MKTALKMMAQVFGDTCEHRRRHVGRAADRLPDLGQQRVRDAAEGARWCIEGDFVPARSTQRRRLKPMTDYNEFAVPVDRQRLPATVVGRRRHRRHVQGHAGDAGAREVPRDAGGGDDLGEARRLHVAEQEREAERLQDALTRTTAIALAQAKIVRFDMSDLAAGGVRRHGRAGRVEDLPGLPQEPEGRQRRSRRARVVGGEGVQVGQVSRAASRAEPLRRGGAAARRHGPAARRGYLVAAVFLAPALDPARRLDRLPGDLHDRPELLRRATARRLRLVRQLQGALHDATAS